MGALKFIRKNGKVIPISAVRGGIVGKKTASAGIRSAGLAVKRPKVDIKPRQGLRALGFGLSAVSGLVGAATFSGSTKKLLGGFALSTGLDVASSSANLAAYAGKEHKKERLKAAVKQEGVNQAVGWGLFAGGLLAKKQNREIVKTGVKKIGMKAAGLLRRV